MAFPIQHRRADPLQAGDVLVVVHDFDARSADELTLRKADRVELVELDDGFGDGWFLGRHLGRNATGLFPGVYTAKLPPNIALIPPISLQSQSQPLPLPQPQQPPQPAPYVHATHASQAPTFNSQLPSLNTSPPISPTSPSKPTPYQHRTEPPSNLRPVSEATSFYGQNSANNSARNTMSSSPAYKPLVQRSIGEALRSPHRGDDSPVMNETLNVIDEHITDLSTPRQSLAPPQTIPEDSESEYSSHLERGSFLAGPESESEENTGLTKEEVSAWDHMQVSRHLRSIGVDPKHCDIFEEQEISGDVLLEMDQSFIHMKEFDFGVMGRRLKTWHKIRDFQTDVRGHKDSRQSSLNQQGSTEDLSSSLSRVTSGGSILPRIPSLMDKSALSIRPSHGHPSAPNSALPSPLQTGPPNGLGRSSLGANTPPSSWRASVGPGTPESPGRPSAAALRELNHSRRHSSIDFGNHPDLQLSSGSLNTASTPHKKQSSFDRDWAGGTATPASTNITSPSTTHVIRKQESLDMSSTSPLLTDAPNLDLDRGYFSGNEIDNRKSKNVLRKREGTGSPAHSRHSSLLDGRTTMATKRHSRLASVDSIRDQDGPLMSPASKAYHSSSFKGRFRSVSARSPVPRQSVANYSPTVTNLETDGGAAAGPGATSAFSTANLPAKARKLMGLRATSDAITDHEKETAMSPTITHTTLEGSPVGTAEDGSQTPSANSQTFEVDSTDAPSKGTESHLGPMLSTRMSRQTKPKNKQQTSAYTKGLLKISPADARKHCDHNGWMKKKSSSLVTTWKPRLFILRGRRLSYYYSENDLEERGIIDISGHKVLVANSDPMLALHATLTGAKSSTSPNANSTGPSADAPPALPKSAKTGTDGPFYFKLVPPKAGLSRAVQFTKPTVHYFQCDTAAEGRKWMGEIMKATIQHDLSSFETTNKQKTISLAKARARKERPPALKEVDEKLPLGADTKDDADGEEEDKENEMENTMARESGTGRESATGRESGLNIQGLNFGETDLKLGLNEGDAKKEAESESVAT